jgi:hypothetical protein
VGEAAARRQRTTSKGALPSAFAGPKATRGGLAKKLVEVSAEVNQRLADGVRRVAPPIGIVQPVAALLRAAGWAVAVDYKDVASGGNALLDVACEHDPEPWRAVVTAAGDIPGAPEDAATILGTLGNPFHGPEATRRESNKNLVAKADEVNKALEAGTRRLPVQVGLVEAVAAELRGSDWSVATEYPDVGRTVLGWVLVAADDDPDAWRELVEKAAGKTVDVEDGEPASP